MTLREWHEERRRINRVIENLTEKANHLAIVKEGNKNAEHPQLIDNERLRQLWAQCDNCYNMQYRKYLRQNMTICQYCGFPMQMSSSDRIELLVDPGTWFPMDENMCTIDVFSEFENLQTEEKMEIPWQRNQKNSKILIDYSYNLCIYYSFLFDNFLPRIELLLQIKPHFEEGQIEQFIRKRIEEIIDKIRKEEPPINDLMQDIDHIATFIQVIICGEIPQYDIIFQYFIQYAKMMEDDAYEAIVYLLCSGYRRKHVVHMLDRLSVVYLGRIALVFALSCFEWHISILENIDPESLQVQSFKDELEEILLYEKLLATDILFTDVKDNQTQLPMDQIYENTEEEVPEEPFSDDTEEEVPENTFCKQYWDDRLRRVKEFLESFSEDTYFSSEDTEEELLKCFSSKDTEEEVPEEPFSEYTKKDPFSEYTKEDPFSEYTKEDPFSEYTKEDPFSEYTKKDPFYAYTKKDPFSEYTKEYPFSEYTYFSSEYTKEEVLKCFSSKDTEEEVPEEPFSEYTKEDPFSEYTKEDPFYEHTYFSSEDTKEEVPKDPFSEKFWDNDTLCKVKKFLEPFSEDTEEEVTEEPFSEDTEEEVTEYFSSEDTEEEVPEDPFSEYTEEEVTEDPFSEQFLEEYNVLPCEEQARERKLALESQKLGEEEEKEEGELDIEEKPYMEHITSYQIDTGLTDAIQTGIGRLNGIPIAIGVMDFQFMGGSMGSVVGEKMTRLIEYATKKSLPLITVCASGGARMQEGSFSLMQMGKIASALNIYQRKKKLFYISILTSPTTGGVTASFGMLPNITIAEPKAYIAFAGRRVIEQTLNLTIEDEDFQTAEYLFHHGLFDQIVPRSILKGVLSDILKLYKFC
uniref:Acetyl-coenzyme A carboxylase carboxyl transferase subunit beta, chloroplastic n=28 Tax=Araucariales TaxID=1446378 RepID=A0A3Q9WT86_LAGFR|nr:acetyl-CoA carboxylase carboxyltransferase beta subunit [Lagarostrobos franklinii]BBF90888.1 acetyl-CoA carboxylase beta subunit [Lagarostrobos franklinii]